MCLEFLQFRIVWLINNIVKGGVCIFSKMLFWTESGRVPIQTCSQSAVRGVSTHDAEERALSAHDGH